MIIFQTYISLRKNLQKCIPLVKWQTCGLHPSSSEIMRDMGGSGTKDISFPWNYLSINDQIY